MLTYRKKRPNKIASHTQLRKRERLVEERIQQLGMRKRQIEKALTILIAERERLAEDRQRIERTRITAEKKLPIEERILKLLAEIQGG